MSDGITRKEFIKLAAGGLVAFGLEGLIPGLKSAAQAATRSTVVVAKNQSPAALTRAAINGLGGMKRFVKPGNTVVIKPNAAWARKPNQAANTNPEMLAEIVRLCKQAGAKMVKVIDHPVDSPDETVFSINGIKKAVQDAGGIMISGRSRSLYKNISIPRAKVVRSSQVLKDVVDADVFINVPIAKVHGAVPLTLSMKNFMGITYDRQSWHNSPDLNQAIADYATFIKPYVKLTIMDANNCLMSNGPKGPGKIKAAKMVIAGTDMVAVDAYTAKAVFGMQPESVRYIKLANTAGVGEMDLKKITVKNV